MWETKNALIWSPNKGFTYGAKREGEEEEEEEEEKGKANPRYGTLDFWYENYFEYGFCMDHMEF